MSRWNQKNIDEKSIEELEEGLIAAQKNGYVWFELQIAGLLTELELSDEKTEKYKQITQRLESETGMEALISLVKVTVS